MPYNPLMKRRSQRTRNKDSWRYVSPEEKRARAHRKTLTAGALVFVGIFTGGMVSTNISLPASLNFGTILTADEAAGSGNTFTCHVTGVHDGDGPIYCLEGQKIRLTAISATELDETCRLGHPCSSTSGADAKAALERLALGQTLECEATGTSYSRITAWCWRPDGTELNCAMVQGGYAVRWDKFDPDNRLCGKTSQ